MDVRCGRGEGCLFSEATERHLIFLLRPLHQGDLQRSRERNRERGRESIKVTVILVQLNPKFY